MTEPTIVVGGGLSGALTAIAMLRRTTDRVVIVEPHDRVGPGWAYGTDDPAHVLNSQANAMGVDPDEPDGFVAWCHRNGLTANSYDFLPRHGRYVAEAAARHPDRLRHIRGRVVRILPVAGGGFALTLGDGGYLSADRVVLAVGHAPTFPPGLAAVVRDRPGYVGDPWAPGALDAVDIDADVLIFGTGLSAVDVVLTLAGRGHTGRISALSRHGLPPLPHSPACPRSERRLCSSRTSPGPGRNGRGHASTRPRSPLLAR